MSVKTHERTHRKQALRAEARRMLNLLTPGGTITLEPGGRPSFADRHADFSISHSRNMAAVTVLSVPPADPGAAAVETGRVPPAAKIPRIGCDIQYADPRAAHTDISRHFFHACERDYIFSANASEQYLRFYRFWALKEAWLKMKGLSVFDMALAPAFNIEEDTGEVMPQQCPKQQQSPFTDIFSWRLASPGGELYMLAVVREPAGGVKPCLQWFSPQLLAALAEKTNFL